MKFIGFLQRNNCKPYLSVVWIMIILMVYTLFKGYSDGQLVTIVISMRLVIGVGIGIFLTLMLFLLKINRLISKDVGFMHACIYLSAITITLHVIFNLLN